jgi:hypothetical protein
MGVLLAFESPSKGKLTETNLHTVAHPLVYEVLSSDPRVLDQIP